MKLDEIDEKINKFLFDRFLITETKTTCKNEKYLSMDITFTEKNNIFRLIYNIKIHIQTFIDMLRG